MTTAKHPKQTCGICGTLYSSWRKACPQCTRRTCGICGTEYSTRRRRVCPKCSLRTCAKCGTEFSVRQFSVTMPDISNPRCPKCGSPYPLPSKPSPQRGKRVCRLCGTQFSVARRDCPRCGEMPVSKKPKPVAEWKKKIQSEYRKKIRSTSSPRKNKSSGSDPMERADFFDW